MLSFKGFTLIIIIYNIGKIKVAEVREIHEEMPVPFLLPAGTALVRKIRLL